jgi:transmembrane 9 superfamily protein 3
MCARQPPRRRAGLPGAAPVAGALFVLLLACAVPARADEYDHKYAVGDRVILWENKVGPYNNPQETYNYHELPFCRVETATDEKPTHKWGGLGEILQGNELIDSGVEFKFRVDQPKTTLCVDVLTQKSAKVFKRAVRKHYWYEFVMDDLPIWGFVGENVEGAADGVDATEVRDDAHIAADAAENDLSADDSGVLRGGRHEKKPSPHGKVSSDMLGHALRDKRHGGALGKRRDDKTQALIYTHKRFDVSFNGDRVVSVNLVAENPKPLVAGASLEFTYSVTWLPSETPFRKRFERYLDYNFFEHQIHWFSIFNSFMMVIFLAGLVSMILMRTLRNDYAKYAQHSLDDVEDLGGDESSESGWKLVHGDVFRAPRHLPTLAALLGTGTQMALLVLFVILITIFGAAYEGRGTIITVFIVCYALTSFVSGYVSGGFNARNSGKRWIKTMLLTAGLFPGACFGVAFFLNTVAIFYHSLAAVPFGTMVVIFFMWSFISFPLVLFGTVVGRNWNGVPDTPCRVKTIPRPIPDSPWYLRPFAVACLSGALPFGSIFIETYFVFTSIWNYKVYYVYGFFLLVFLILMIVTLCVTIVGTYFLLNAENHKWQWTAFCGAASVSGYVYAYSVYYFLFKTKMTGFFQTCFYFGYTAMFCLALGVMCGATGYVGSNAFVRRIYRNVKVD